MINKLESILEKSKIGYKESVLIDNEVLQDALLSIMSDVKYLIDNSQQKKQIVTVTQPITIEDEIEKVQRKIPQWFDKPRQINSQILVAFIQLSRSNQIPIDVSTLEKHCNIDSKTFNSNYAQMKLIAPKNHSKVFEEVDGKVTLWSPVAEFIIAQYTKTLKRIR